MRRFVLVAAAFLLGLPDAARAQCGGVERWAVKMGSDPAAAQIDIQNPIVTSLHDLVRLARPTLPTDDITRGAAERVVRVVDGRLIRFKRESGKTGDADFHLVISDETGQFTPGGAGSTVSSHSFIAEIPDPNCVSGRHGDVPTPSSFATQLTDVRARFLQQFPTITSGWNEVAALPVRLTGVVYFDRPHGQVGRALNGLELHPLLDIVFNPGSPIAPVGPAPAAPVVTVALTNPGFEAGNTGWTATADVITTNANQAAHQGQGKAWLGGVGEAHTDRLSQSVTLPAAAHAISVSFFLHIDTEEANQTAFDKLTVRVRSANGQFLKQLAVFTNLQAAQGFALRSFDLTQFKGRTIRIELEAKEDNGSVTSFVVDDFSVVVEP